MPPASITYEHYAREHRSTYLPPVPMMGEVEDEDYMSHYKVPIEWFVRFFDCNLRQAFQVPDGHLAHMVLRRVGFIRILMEGSSKERLMWPRKFTRHRLEGRRRRRHRMKWTVTATAPVIATATSDSPWTRSPAEIYRAS